LQRKVGQYLDAGAALVWVVYPERSKVAVFEATGLVLLLGEEEELCGEPVLPCFRCRVGDLFR
jgi:Uma2 family endonuclease